MSNSEIVIPRNYLSHLRDMAHRGLKRMYMPEEKAFIFCMRKNGDQVLPEGKSPRYTAITLIGLAAEEEDVVSTILSGQDYTDVCDHFRDTIKDNDNLGDVALMIWASCAMGYRDRKAMWERLVNLAPLEGDHFTVELSWALDAACVDPDSPVGLVDKLARRLMSSFNPRARAFPHIIANDGGGLRSHVSCFADMVYPIHALSSYTKKSGNKEAVELAGQCAALICEKQGPTGQWWWHYDYRTGDVLEGYPVYSVHQDAMAPMALFALKDAGGTDYSNAILKGLEWLARSSEIGGTLVDGEADLIWRKVARREPGKITRYLQAIVSRMHPALRVPGSNLLFKPGFIDYENRPYHLGWLLYAWPAERAREWDRQDQPI